MDMIRILRGFQGNVANFCQLLNPNLMWPMYCMVLHTCTRFIGGVMVLLIDLGCQVVIVHPTDEATMFLLLQTMNELLGNWALINDASPAWNEMSTPQGWQDWNFPVLMFELSMWIISHWKKRSTVRSIWSTPIPIILETWRLLGFCWVSGCWMWKKNCNASFKKNKWYVKLYEIVTSMVDKWHFLGYDFRARFGRNQTNEEMIESSHNLSMSTNSKADTGATRVVPFAIHWQRSKNSVFR